MLKRLYIVISLLVTLTSAAVMFSSCVDHPQQQEDGNPKPNKDVYEVTVGMVNLYSPSADQPGVSGMIHDAILQKFYIDIQAVTLAPETYNDQLAWMMSVDQLPDLLYHDSLNNKLQFREMLDTGKLQHVPKKLWAQMTNLSRVLSWYEDVYSIDGSMYFIPRTYQTFDQTHGSSNVIFYRSDWASALGYTVTDYVQFSRMVDILKAYVGTDPDGNTKKDTWGLTGSGGITFLKQAFFEPFGVRDWMYENGKWIPGLISDSAKEAMAWICQLYRDGIIDPDIVDQTPEQAMSKFLTGKAGAVLAGAYCMQTREIEEKWAMYNPTRRVESAIAVLPKYETPRGVYYNENDTFETVTLFSSKIEDDEMENILWFFDWLYSAEGRTYMSYGNAGEHYTETGGVITSNLTDQNGSPANFGSMATEYAPLVRLASWNYDCLSSERAAMSEFRLNAAGRVENGYWPWSWPDMMFTDGMFEAEMCTFDMDTVAQQKLLNLMMTTMDFDADWQIYVQECYTELNIEGVSELVAQKARELGITPQE